MVRRVGFLWRCVECGEDLDLPEHSAPPQTVLHAAGGKPNMRVLMVDGAEVHRCVVARTREAGRVDRTSRLA